MGYFDKVVEAKFKDNSSGEILFYPSGIIGKGRVVPSDDAKNDIIKCQKYLLKLTLFIGLPYAWIVGMSGVFSIVSICPLVLLALYVYYKQRQCIANLEVHDSKLSLKEASSKGAKALPDWYYWFLGISSIGMAIISLLLPILCDAPYIDFIYPIIGLFSFGVLGLLLSVKLYELKKLNQ